MIANVICSLIVSECGLLELDRRTPAADFEKLKRKVGFLLFVIEPSDGRAYE